MKRIIFIIATSAALLVSGCSSNDNDGSGFGQENPGGPDATQVSGEELALGELAVDENAEPLEVNGLDIQFSEEESTAFSPEFFSLN